MLLCFNAPVRGIAVLKTYTYFTAAFGTLSAFYFIMIATLFTFIFIAALTLACSELYFTLLEIEFVSLPRDKKSFYMFNKKHNNQPDTDNYYDKIELSDLYPFIQENSLN
ncbi:MAG: hypothetical protein ACTHJ5_19435 [Ilyomonas sp.]